MRRTALFAFALLALTATASDRRPGRGFLQGQAASVRHPRRARRQLRSLYAAVGAHITRYMPGHPEVLPVNMPGGGGLTALNYTLNVAPHDGTVLTMVTSTAPMDQVLGYLKAPNIDLRALQWIGNMSDENYFLVTSRESRIANARRCDQARRAARRCRCGRYPADPCRHLQQHAGHQVQEHRRLSHRRGNESGGRAPRERTAARRPISRRCLPRARMARRPSTRCFRPGSRNLPSSRTSRCCASCEDAGAEGRVRVPVAGREPRPPGGDQQQSSGRSRRGAAPGVRPGDEGSATARGRQAPEPGYQPLDRGASCSRWWSEILDTPAADIVRIKQAIDAGNAEEIRAKK